MSRTQIKFLVIALIMFSGGVVLLTERAVARLNAFHPLERPPQVSARQNLTEFQKAILQDLERQKREVKQYNSAYFHGGDPPASIGVCTDVVLRSYRKAGVDLYKDVNIDIRKHPTRYHISKPDSGIDHRRCKNLVPYCKAHATSLPLTKENADWKVGDIVFWDTYGNGNVDHVGVIANGKTADGTPTVVHHWPNRPVAEADCLYRFHTVHHFRWKPSATEKRDGKRNR